MTTPKKENPFKKAAVEFTAGTVGGVAQVLAGHPFDTIKVRLQTMPAVNPGEIPRYTGMVDCAKKTIAGEGVGGLFKGMTSPLAGVAIMTAVLFAVNGQVKRLIHRDTSKPMTVTQYVVGGGLTGIAVAFVVSPVELLKSKLQVQDNLIKEMVAAGRKDIPPRATGPVDLAMKLFKAEGVPGVFRGLGITIAREIPSNAFYFGVYEGVKLAMKGGDKDRQLSSGELLLAGGLGGMGYWGFTYPIDNVKTRIQIDDPTNPKYRGIVDCFQKVYRTEGMKGFFKGYTPCMVRSFPANAVTFLGFEMVVKAFSS